MRSPISRNIRLTKKSMIEVQIVGGWIVAAWFFDDLDVYGGGLSCAEWRAA